MGKIVIDKILNGRLLEFCYFVHDEDSKKCICIDPGYDVDRIMKFIDTNSLIIDTILLTHGHFDHILACKKLQDRFNSKIYVSKIDESILYEATHNYAILINKTTFDTFNITRLLDDGDVIDSLSYTIKCISTPGHTKGSLCYYFEKEKILFSGDTLFKDTYGRVDLYSGSFDDMKNSLLNKLFKLPDDTIVYPGHGHDTTIEYEKNNNEIYRGAV